YIFGLGRCFRSDAVEESPTTSIRITESKRSEFQHLPQVTGIGPYHATLAPRGAVECRRSVPQARQFNPEPVVLLGGRLQFRLRLGVHPGPIADFQGLVGLPFDATLALDAELVPVFEEHGPLFFAP